MPIEARFASTNRVTFDREAVSPHLFAQISHESKPLAAVIIFRAIGVTEVNVVTLLSHPNPSELMTCCRLSSRQACFCNQGPEADRMFNPRAARAVFPRFTGRLLETPALCGDSGRIHAGGHHGSLLKLN
jgi:hypothetical protein